MIDRLFSALLTFTLLAGGTVAIGSELMRTSSPAPQQASAPQVIQLERVVITGHKTPAAPARSTTLAQGEAELGSPRSE